MQRANGRVAAVSCCRAHVQLCTSLRAWRSREGDTANCKIQIFRTLRSKRDVNFETFEFCSWQCLLLFFFMHNRAHCSTQLHVSRHSYTAVCTSAPIGDSSLAAVYITRRRERVSERGVQIGRASCRERV